MKELDLSWEQFVEDYTSNSISVQVDKNKGHSIMSGPLAPSNWRLMIKLVLFIAMISLPAAIVLFFFVKW